MSPLSFLFGKKSNRVSPASASKSVDDSSEGTCEIEKRDGKKKSPDKNKVVEQCLDAESKEMVQSCVRGSTRRHGLCDKMIREDAQLLRKKLLVQALVDANMM